MKRKLSEAFGVAQALSRAYASAKGGNYSDQLVIKYFRKKKGNASLFNGAILCDESSQNMRKHDSRLF